MSGETICKTLSFQAHPPATNRENVDFQQGRAAARTELCMFTDLRAVRHCKTDGVLFALQEPAKVFLLSIYGV
jgi:hypothetical protein